VTSASPERRTNAPRRSAVRVVLGALSLACCAAACGATPTRTPTPWSVEVPSPVGGSAIAIDDGGLFVLVADVDEDAALESDASTRSVLRRHDLWTGDAVATLDVPEGLNADQLAGMSATDGLVIAWTNTAVAWFDAAGTSAPRFAGDQPCGTAPVEVVATRTTAAVRCANGSTWASAGDTWTEFTAGDTSALRVAAHRDRIFVLTTREEDFDVALDVRVLTGPDAPDDPTWSGPLFDPPSAIEVHGGRLYARIDDYRLSSRRLADGRGVREIEAAPSAASHLGGWYVGRDVRTGQVLRMHRVRAWELDAADPTWTTWLPVGAVDRVVASLGNDGVVVEGGGIATLLDRTTGDVVWTVEIPEDDDGSCQTLGASRAGFVRRCLRDDGIGVVVHSLAPTDG